MFSSNTSQVSQDQVFIEDVFSAYLYTGNGSTQTITNGIDLAGKGGLVWVKKRDSTTVNASHYLVDTVRGAGNYLSSNSTNASASDSQISAFNSNGFYIGSDGANVNLSGSAYASWTFRKQAKFFDVVTYTGDGTTTRNISHALGSAPGCMIVRRYDDPQSWSVYHRSLSSTANILQLNSTAAQASSPNSFASTAPTSSVFTVGVSLNAEGGLYVAYLFAHNAGGFGLSGSDNVISCGSYTGVSSGALDINLGYETQWVLIKKATANNGVNRDWLIVDTMRGMPALPGYANGLFPNTSGAETANNEGVHPSATGFYLDGGFDRVCNSGETYIYIAIRRGPMKTPTSGTSVYEPVTYTGNGVVSRVVSYSLTPDSVISGWRGDEFIDAWANRLTNKSTLNTQTTNAESNNRIQGWDVQNGLKVGEYGEWNANTRDYINWVFKRAPGFFDVVCYTGTGSARTVSHNLGVIPELMIVKSRSNATDWDVYHKDLGATKYLLLNLQNAVATDSGEWNNTTPTASVFTVGNAGNTNFNTRTYVAYLFATVAGVSKVGSYTGTGTTKQIDCGFTGGARFVLIKRTDSTGDWYVWDSARGIVAGNDPYLLLNSTAAEVTSTDYVDTYSAGFEISSTAPAAINANGGTFIFLAIA